MVQFYDSLAASEIAKHAPCQQTKRWNNRNQPQDHIDTACSRRNFKAVNKEPKENISQILK